MRDVLSDPAVMRLQQKLHYVGSHPLSPSQIRKLKRQVLGRVLEKCTSIRNWQDRLPEFWGYFGGTEFAIKN